MYWIVNHSLDPTFNLALEEYFLGRIEPGHPGYAILAEQPGHRGGAVPEHPSGSERRFRARTRISVVRRMTGRRRGLSRRRDAQLYLHPSSGQGRSPARLQRSRKTHRRGAAKAQVARDFSGRNDLMLDGLKVAGVAHCRRGMRYLHHGCILVNSDLDVLSQALNVDPARYKSKGVASVRNRVGESG